MSCPQCKHEDHRPGQCDYDDCGESEICHSTEIPEMLDIDNLYSLKRKSQIYTRNGRARAKILERMTRE